jgi:hypothetical protein
MSFWVTLVLAYAAIVIASSIGTWILLRPEPREAHRDGMEPGLGLASPGRRWYDTLPVKFLGAIILSPVIPVIFVLGLWVRLRDKN